MRSRRTKAKKRNISKARITCEEVTSDEVPFVPDYKLLEKLRAKPTEHEVVAIGVALLELTTPATKIPSSWELIARAESVSERF